METSTLELKTTIEDLLSVELEIDLLDELDSKIYTKNDFYIEIDRAEYRFINADAIWWIYQEEQEDLIKDCYLGGIELPYWLKIDWEQTCENVLNADGYGHHFSRYDGSEEEFNLNGESWYIFRTN
jgi:hypothetical protein